MVKINMLSSYLLRSACLSVGLLSVLLLAVPVAYAEEGAVEATVDAEKAGYTLLLILVLAILLETGLSTFFNWRIYLRYLDGFGAKTPIAVVAASVFLFAYDIDAVAKIMSAFGHEPSKPSIPGTVLTALIVAGGSSAVFTLFTKLNLRNPLERKGVAETEQNISRIKIKVPHTNVCTVLGSGRSPRQW